MAQACFDRGFSYEMAVEADELAQREEKEAQERSQTYGIPSDQRVQLVFERPEVRSTQSGGTNTRPRAGTFEERRALAAINLSGKGKKSKGKGKSGSKTCVL